MLDIAALTIRYGAITAVQDASFTVGQGEVVGLIGPNGAGKTSILMAVAGVVRAAAGRIAFEGRDITASRPEDTVRLGISVVPETREIFARLSVAENLRIGATVRQRGPTIAADLERVMDLFPILRERAGQAAGQMSGGEQQMLAIGRALMARPKILMLDEPSLGLAPAVTDIVYRTITQLAGEGLTILLVEQDARRVASVCGRAYLLVAGGVQWDGAPAGLLAHDRLESAYFGARDPSVRERTP